MKNENLKNIFLFGIIGPIFYIFILTILGFLWEGYNPVSKGMSEIGAVDSPYKDLMNYLGFSSLGISIFMFGIGYSAYFKKNIQLKIASILILLGGISMFLVGFLPCDSKCVDVTITGRLHSFMSFISAIFIPLAAMLSAYPISKIWNKKWGYLSFYLGLISMSAGPIMFLIFLNNYSGLIQRIGIGMSLLWIFLISKKIFKLLSNRF